MDSLVLIGIGVLTLAIIACAGLSFERGSVLLFLLGVLAAVASVLGGLFFAFVSWDYIAAEHKAGLINRQLGTHYTREDVFYGSGYIDEVREMHRKRIELNGDLLREKD